MVLQKSTLPVQFVGGLDQKHPIKGVVPGKFLLLENCVRRKYALVEKRLGTTSLSRTIFGTSTTITEGRHLDTFQDDLLVFGNDKVFSYSQSRNSWVDKGTCTTAHVDSMPLIRNSDTQTLADIDTSDGLTVVAWEDSRNGVRYSVFDDSTGTALVYDQSVTATGLQPKVVALRDVFLLCYIEGSALKVRVIAKVTPTTLGSAINVVGSGVDSTAYWDIDPFQETYAVFAVSTTAPDVEIGYLDQNGVVGAPGTNTLPAPIHVGTTAADDFCSIIGDAMNGKIWLLFGSTTEVKLIAVTDDLVSSDDILIAAETARNATGVVRAADGHLLVFYEVGAVSLKDHYVRTARFSYVVAGTITQQSAAATLIKSVGLASKAFEVGSNQYFNASHDSVLQPTYFTIRHDGFKVTRIAGNIGGGHSKNTAGTLTSGIPRVRLDDDNKYTTVFQVRNRLQIETGGTTLKSNKGLHKASLSFDAAVTTRTLGRNIHIGGGSLLAYDGTSVFEHGFYLFPEDIAQTTPGGGSLAAGTYNFRVLYEWVDGQGQLHRSAPSVTVSATAALNDSVVLAVPTLRITNRNATSIKIVTYMAAIGLSAVYYRKNETANTTASDTVNVTISTAADPSQEVVYTTGGTLENIAPPASKAVHTHKNRMWLGGLENDEVWYSKEFVEGEAVAFSDFFRMSMESIGGGITAFASLDSSLIMFKRDRMYYLAGEGPIDTGAQNDYGRPQLIASDVGTTIPNSVVETPFGTIFKSDKGFYLLGRNFKLKYVGDAVEDFNALTVTSAVLLADENEVRFTTSTGVCLVYNYYFDQWSTFSNYVAVSACNGIGSYLHLKSDGKVKQEIVGQYEDDGARYSMAIETSWFAFAGLQGFQRIYQLALIGDFISHHYTKLQVAYDYENAYNQTVYFNTMTGLVSDSVYGEGDVYGDPDVVYGGAGSEVYQFRFKPARQKCESMKLRIEDIDTIGTNGGGSVKFMALTFDIGRKAGIYRLPGVKSIGA